MVFEITSIKRIEIEFFGFLHTGLYFEWESEKTVLPRLGSNYLVEAVEHWTSTETLRISIRSHRLTLMGEHRYTHTDTDTQTHIHTRMQRRRIFVTTFIRRVRTAIELRHTSFLLTHKHMSLNWTISMHICCTSTFASIHNYKLNAHMLRSLGMSNTRKKYIIKRLPREVNNTTTAKWVELLV